MQHRRVTANRNGSTRSLSARRLMMMLTALSVIVSGMSPIEASVAIANVGNFCTVVVARRV